MLEFALWCCFFLIFCIMKFVVSWEIEKSTQFVLLAWSIYVAWNVTYVIYTPTSATCTRANNAPINSKLQHPPRAYPGHLTVHRARGGENLNVALEGWGIWTGFISCSDVIGPWIFWVFAGSDGFARKNFAFVGLLKTIEGVITTYLSLYWKACKVFDWRPNLTLRRGSSVPIGGAFERLSCPEGREFEQANLQKFKCPGVAREGGDVELYFS